MWPLPALAGLVVLLLVADRQPPCRAVLAWLPIPLWCYGVPMILRAAGWLPTHHASYGWITDQLFPVALGLLLVGVDLRALSRLGLRAIAAMTLGSVGIVFGGPVVLACLKTQLPADAWKGIGTLAATWTGGSLNMLALRTILDVPDAVFAPLVVVDALIAYSWMACLISGKAVARPLGRWLRSSDRDSATREATRETPHTSSGSWHHAAAAFGVCVGLSALCQLVSRHLPLGGLVASMTGWTVLLVSTVALGLSCLPAVRRLGQRGASVGYPCLYLVLAALGAQANLAALAATPAWIFVGLGLIIAHALVLLVAGRWLRLPLGLLATASQACVGGVISAPLVGAVYDPSLAPVGLLLALAGNALGTYLGLLSATLCRWLV